MSDIAVKEQVSRHLDVNANRLSTYVVVYPEGGTASHRRPVAHAFPELRCTFGGRSIVPDVTVFAWDRIPVDESGDIANTFPICPDWTIEILSPGQSPTKVTGNTLHCLKHGCQMGWLIDPEERSLLIYLSGQQPEFFQEEHEILPIPALVTGLQLKVSSIFGWLRL